MSNQLNIFTPLLCINRIEETADSATFEFKNLDDSLFEYKAGQFLTFEIDVAGQIEYRAYSLSSTPSIPESVAITIKRVPGGLISNYLLDNLKAGFALPAMAPAGQFTIQDNQTTTELLLMSAGSGITPCISIARWLLDTNQQVNIHFIYSARSEADVIMAETLNTLKKQYAHFRLTRILEQPNNPDDIEGILDTTIFKQLIPDSLGKTIFICGPSSYMKAVESIAESNCFDMSLFHKESFTPLIHDEVMNESDINYQIVAPQYGKNFTVSESQSLLEALEAAGVPVIGACRSGVCGSCKCKVIGDVKSTSQATLTPEQITQGYVLSCSSKAYSDLVIEL